MIVYIERSEQTVGGQLPSVPCEFGSRDMYSVGSIEECFRYFRRMFLRHSFRHSGHRCKTKRHAGDKESRCQFFCQLIHTYITRAIAKWYETRSHLSGTGSHTYLPDSVFSETVIPPEPPLRSPPLRESQCWEVQGRDVSSYQALSVQVRE